MISEDSSTEENSPKNIKDYEEQRINLENDGDTYPSIYQLSMNPFKGWISYIIFIVILVVISILIFVYSIKHWYVALTLLGTAAAVLLQTKREIYLFDPASNRFILKSWRILGVETKFIMFHEIKEVVLEESLDAQGGEEIDLYLQLRGGQKIQLLSTHLCGLEAKSKRQAFKVISFYIKGSRTQLELDYDAILQRKSGNSEKTTLS